MKTKTTTLCFIYDEKAGDFKFNFGKYKGGWLGSVAKENPSYLNWMYVKGDFSPIDCQIIEEVCEELDIDLEEVKK